LKIEAEPPVKPEDMPGKPEQACAEKRAPSKVGKKAPPKEKPTCFGKLRRYTLGGARFSWPLWPVATPFNFAGRGLGVSPGWSGLAVGGAFSGLLGAGSMSAAIAPARLASGRNPYI